MCLPTSEAKEHERILSIFNEGMVQEFQKEQSRYIAKPPLTDRSNNSTVQVSEIFKGKINLFKINKNKSQK